MEDKQIYHIISENDNSLKQFFDRFYVIPKDNDTITDLDRRVIEKYYTVLADDLVAQGKNGYIVFRGKKPKKLTYEQIQEIRADDKSTQRQLAFKYGCSHSTINKIKNDKY